MLGVNGLGVGNQKKINLDNHYYLPSTKQRLQC